MPALLGHENEARRIRHVAGRRVDSGWGEGLGEGRVDIVAAGRTRESSQRPPAGGYVITP